MAWDVARYLSFGEARQRPAIDLIARIPLTAPDAIVDLGCGPGTVTRLLRERWPAARIVGIDSSTAMLDQARALMPEVTWIEGDISAHALPIAACDLLFSNAALHWLPVHPALFSRLCRCVRPGGVFAVQMPDNFAAPSHRLIREVAARPPFAAVLDDVRMGAVLAAAEYHDLLSGLGAEVELWSTEYLQPLRGAQPVLDWLRGTTLVPYLDRLGDLAPEFLDELGRQLAAAYPRRTGGAVLFPFRRLFIVGRF